jgi:UDP-N-acetylmuramyl pentapeptide phosphotransferase/UDP-N-acetylglucosamine-1-phosphate transferase
MLPAPPTGALAASDRWLIAFAGAVGLVLVGAGLLRRAARAARDRAANGGPTARIRRRAGALIVAGPLLGLALAPEPDAVVVIAAVGAAALAGVGLLADRRPGADRLVPLAVGIGGAAAVVAGLRFVPTGVSAVGVAGAVALVALVTLAFDGLGDTDGLAVGVALALSAGVFALAAFGGQDDLAAVTAGLGGACAAFLAFNLRPASLFLGRPGRLAAGYVIGVAVLDLEPVDGTPARVVVPALFVGLLLLDAGFVVVERLRYRRPLLEQRADHLVHRLRARRFTPAEAVGVLVATQVLLSALGLFAGRGVLSPWLAAAIGAGALMLVGFEAGRADLDPRRRPGLTGRARIGVAVAVAVVAALVLPLAVTASRARDAMDRGRDAAVRGLDAAREGDALTARYEFRRAALAFEDAHDQLSSPLVAGSLAVPGLAPNVRAARELAAIGGDLARTGEEVTAAVEPDRLEVVEGRIPLDEVQRIQPELADGARALDDALARVRDLDSPYLVPMVDDAVDRLEDELARASGEAENTAAAARLAPAILGGESPRRYLLVVQNNAELRATGGLIGNWGIVTAEDGDVDVGRLQRTSAWNEAVDAADGPVTYDAPDDYRHRYDRFLPATTLQSVNLSPDFPTVARVLASLAPQAGVGEVDGVIAVDPFGLAALLELTGPVDVEGWPEPISASNVVDVTMRDAYTEFEDSPGRPEFLGDVAQRVVDEATDGTLGEPARIAEVLGRSGHQGHVQVWMVDADEQALAAQLDLAGAFAPAASDTLLVNSQNAAPNKIDYYLERSVDYRVTLDPVDDDATAARVHGQLTVRLENTAPGEGLPVIVIGPSEYGATNAGENLALVSVYSPLALEEITLDGAPLGDVESDTELGLNVYSFYVRVPARATGEVVVELAGTVALDAGGWYELVLGRQPVVNPDHARVAVQVADGWRIADAAGVEPNGRVAVGASELGEPTRVAVRIERDPPSLDLWDRLRAGT